MAWIAAPAKTKPRTNHMNDITEILRKLDGGKPSSDASDDLAALVAEVRQTGNKAKLTIEFCIQPTSDETAQIIVALKSSRPSRDYRSTTFFHDDEGNLYRNNPKQGEMFEPRAVEGGDQAEHEEKKERAK